MSNRLEKKKRREGKRRERREREGERDREIERDRKREKDLSFQVPRRPTFPYLPPSLPPSLAPSLPPSVRELPSVPCPRTCYSSQQMLRAPAGTLTNTHTHTEEDSKAPPGHAQNRRRLRIE